MIEKLKRASWPQVVVLLALIVSVVFTLHSVPERIWDRVVDKEPEVIVGYVSTLVLGLAGLFAQMKRRGPSLLPLAFVALTLSACGASAVTRSTYALEQARCIANEREIIDRESTEEEDTRDMAIERARCDAALAIIGGE